jgi:C4-dicarboxylate transporter DctM subunit
MLAVLFFIFLAFLAIGVHIAFSMGVGVVASFLYGMPRGMMNIPTKVFAGLDSFSLMAIPFFILAGDLMTASGISRKLINFADLLVGWIRGGIALVTVVACVIFASVCGSAAASTSAIGGIMISSMTEKGYAKGFTACLVASGGTIGPIIPPSILAVLYGSATGLSVGALFIAGVFPGLVLAFALVVVSLLYARKHPEIAKSASHLTIAEKRNVLVEALPALFMPVIIIGGILSGIVTATEASGIACLYGIAVGFLGRSLTIRQCWDVFAKSAASVSKLMLIVGVATLFGWILSVRRFPVMAADFITSVTDNSYAIMFMIIGMLIIIGLFMETVAALIILIPVLYPLGQQIGFDAVHYAIIIIVTLLFGAITPPVGILLYITSNIAGIKLQESLRYIFPFIIAFLVVILILVLFPSLTIALPKILDLM